MKKLLLCLTLVLACYTSATADTDLQISAAEINGFGVFETRSSSRRTGFSRNTMAADSVTGVQFREYTRDIPGRLGVNFGFLYRINTSPRGQKLNVRSVIRFPEPGLQNPGGRLYTESVEKRSITIGENVLHGYGFDEEWEIVPGDWIFEIWYNDARIIRKTFTVSVDVEESADS